MIVALDNFKAFQKFLVQITDTLETEIFIISEKSHKVFDILLAAGPARIALLINESS